MGILRAPFQSGAIKFKYKEMEKKTKAVVWAFPSFSNRRTKREPEAVIAQTAEAIPKDCQSFFNQKADEDRFGIQSPAFFSTAP
jgi:hypothetical protein